MRALGLALAMASFVAASAGSAQPGAPAPRLTYAFTARVELAAPVEQGSVAGGRKRFIPITGGRVYGPRLTGTVLPGGGDWQTIFEGGLTRVDARYFLKADDGSVIEVTNPGVRTATPEVIERLTRGEEVDPSLYYFRTSPRFDVPAGRNAWLGRTVFVARGIRKPDHVIIDFYSVD